MKKTIAILIAVTLCTVMGACGEEKDNIEGDDASTSISSRQETSPSRHMPETEFSNPTEPIEPETENPAAGVPDEVADELQIPVAKIEGPENPTGNPAAGVPDEIADALQNPESFSFPSDQKMIIRPYGMDYFSIQDMIKGAFVENANQISSITITSTDSSMENTYTETDSINSIFSAFGNIIVDGENPLIDGDVNAGIIVVTIVFNDNTYGRFDLMRDYIYVNQTIGPYAYAEGSGYSSLSQYA